MIRNQVRAGAVFMACAGFASLMWFATAALAAADLHRAAYEGDLPAVKALLARPFDPDARDQSGGTALHAAMFQKNMEIVVLLLEHGFDVNARGRSNGYTPLHDAVWAENAQAVEVLLRHGARTDIVARDGLTAYTKAKKEGKEPIAALLEAASGKSRSYDPEAKSRFSENDVKSFMYQWFAGFDHQVEIGFFEKHLDPARVDMLYPDFPVTSLRDFGRWYDGVITSIQWNAHHIERLDVSGDERNGFTVTLTVNWRARTYNGEAYDLTLRQTYNLRVDADRHFIIGKMRAEVMP